MIRASSRQMPSLAFLITSKQSSATSVKIYSQDANQILFNLIDLSFFSTQEHAQKLIA